VAQPLAGAGVDAVGVEGTEPSAIPTQAIWRESQITFSFGLSIATFLTLNMILSDPVAGFDYLASRLDADARQPNRGQRRPVIPHT
jgi:hypothetical protein